MPNLMEIKSQFKKFSLDNLFLGTVKDSSDPEQKSRVRVEVDELTKGIPVTELPWYIVLKGTDAGANSSVSVPRVGSRVIVEFPNNDIYNGLVRNIISSVPPGA